MIAVVMGSSTATPARPNKPPAAPVIVTDNLCHQAVDVRTLVTLSAWSASPAVPPLSRIVETATANAPRNAALTALSTTSGATFSSPLNNSSKGLPTLLAMVISHVGFSRYRAASLRNLASLSVRSEVCCAGRRATARSFMRGDEGRFLIIGPPR